MCGTILGGTAVSSQAQAQEAAQPVPAVPADDTIRSIVVSGAQRLEPTTVLSYMKLRVGQTYTQESADQALKDLFETELFKDVSIRNNDGAVIIEVVENPVINRILLEGNKRIKEDKIYPEIRLAPRQIFTRSKVRADVARIVELYKRKGRFAANVEPKMVQLDQNRVDIVFEINEGPKSKVQQINIIGNEEFSDGQLRGEMVTKQSRFYRFFSSSDTYDPDRLAFDQQKLRQFYLTEGYADFRVISAVAELTPDKRDFIITYVVEEGDRYKFGDVAVESEIRDFTPEFLTPQLPMKSGDFYNAKQVEDTVERLSETAGLFGYAFADVRPQFTRNKDTLTMDILFQVAESDRVYVERIDINGNTLTQDKVVRREFRLNEGDAFNSFQVKRSANRIKSLGFFQEDLEIEQKQGSAPDRIILEANVEEKATGQLQLSAGFSSVENFILQASVQQRNFRGKGQELRASVSYSSFSQSIELGFTEPYLFDRNIAIGADIFRRDLNSFNFVNNDRETTFEQLTTGFQIRAGVPITEYLSASFRYGLSQDDVTLEPTLFFTDSNGDGIRGNSPADICDPIIAGRFLCDALGMRTTSSIGTSLIYDDRDNRIRPTRGQSIVGSLDFAGLGGSVKYVRGRLNASKHWRVLGDFIFTVSGEGGYIHPLENRSVTPGDGIDDVRLTDRFFLGEPQMRGFDIRGIGPRVVRSSTIPGLDANGNPINEIVEVTNGRQTDDAIGGRAYYLGRAELEIPLGSGARELGLRPSVFVDVGAVFKVAQPLLLTDLQTQRQRTIFNDQGVAIGVAPEFLTVDADGNATVTLDSVDANGNPNPIATNFVERFFGDTPSPRVSVGIGVNWNSPFGPFRIDVAKALLKEPGDDTKLFTFNVGTQF
ncbi:MAG: outer membrane protein assembly factor BamA [Sphingomonadales bacterium]|nr:outer membrane protein assembly factor BamA [Sphingomonadales bacterium]PIX65994.1 MAG: outer membrane protein assembly factor BamA [Sphingomonadales bacterium CG_4_10_14_3_um_filter_58_15]NCO48791.1 outer membrane protein assembly factor BamA [Sphingomonadales bacterium]NCO99874.1 outer membrane protein assembly factor BamA [Sphingomonadales bacterium]NCP27362.1 outer membrane protein assembly factor BamA [Sphingomonadales bacterium]